MSELITIELTKAELSDLIMVADLSLFDAIREDENIDNIKWVAVRIKLIDKLLRANGEEGIL